MTTYAAGLRAGEVAALKPEHIDSERMLIKVVQAKGIKDRYTMLSTRLLEELRGYYKKYQPQTYLFPSSFKTREDRPQSLLPVNYFHVVFTLPHELNAVILNHKRLMLHCLFAAASQTLLRFGKNQMGGTPGFLAFLHTWNQKLMAHFHLHCQEPKEKPLRIDCHQRGGVYPQVPAAQPARRIGQNPSLRVFGQSQPGGKAIRCKSLAEIASGSPNRAGRSRRDDVPANGHRYYRLPLLFLKRQPSCVRTVKRYPMITIASPRNTAQSVYITMPSIFKRFVNNLNATPYRLFMLLAPRYYTHKEKSHRHFCQAASYITGLSIIPQLIATVRLS
jgi:hypothetical protein